MKAPFTISLNRVDTDLVVRNLIFSIIYVGAILACFSYVLWPMILQFKSQYIIEKKEKIIYTEVKKSYDASVQRLQDFVQNNQNSFAKLHNQDALNIAQELIAQHIEIKSVKQISQGVQENDQTRSATYEFLTQTKQIEKLWQLMDKISQLQASIVIKPPIRIQRASMQADMYEVAFSLEIRYNTYQTPKHLQELMRATSSK